MYEWRECFEAPTALENRFILSQMGPLSGKKLLDIGAGLGESSVYFALQGAHVTTVDISRLMVETALQLGRKFGVALEGIVSSAEDLNLPPAMPTTSSISRTQFITFTIVLFYLSR